MKKKVYVDRRPLPILFFIEYRKTFLLLISIMVFFAFISTDNTPQSLTAQSYQALVIFFFAIFLWVTNIIPLAITSLMVMGLLASFHVLEVNKIYSFFGNEAVFFIIGSFIISAGISSSGLNDRIAYYVLSRFGDTPHRLVLSIFFLSAFLAHIMPEHAVAALLFPILQSVSERLKLHTNSVLGKYMFFSLAWGCVIGGVVTFLGGARNPLAIGIMFETTGGSIGFLEWVITVAPPTYLILAIIAVYIKKKVGASTRDTRLIETMITSNRKRMGKINLKEIKAISILLSTIYMWIFYSEKLGVANIALLSSALFFVFDIMSWQDARKAIDWGPIFMYGGAIALGKSLVETRVLDFVAREYVDNINFTVLSFIFSIFFISIFLTEGVSNTVVVVILLPLVLQIASKFGYSPKLAVYLVAVPAGLAFMFPMSATPNAIAFSSGYIKVSEAIKVGIVFKVISIIVFGVFALIYWPFIGVY